jgi:hypothetical protein
MESDMTSPIQHTLRKALAPLLVSAAVIACAGAAGAQAPATAPATPPSNAYEKVATTDPDVQAAVKVALANQQQKNRSDVKLLSIVSAERQPVSGRNLRLCLSTDRNGNTEFARVVLSRNPKKQWAVAIWSWGSCGR